MCPRVPNPEDRKGAVWMEVAGSPCIPWCKGAYGTGLQWLHPVSVPFYIWLHTMRMALPDVICHENVPMFDWTVFEKVLNVDEQRYLIMTHVWSPEQQGCPVKRPRRYTICLRMKSIYTMSDFGEKAFKLLCTCGHESSSLMS